MLLGFFGIETGAWSQRSFRGETALGFGLPKPAFANEYGEHDLLAVWLTIMITLLLKIDMRQAAELVRSHWKAWLRGLSEAEWQPRTTPYSERPCFVIVTDTNREKFEVEVGPCEKLFDKMGDAYPNSVPVPIPIDLVLRQFRNRAQKAGLNDLPKHFTPGLPGSTEFEAWFAEAERYHEFAGMKGHGRKKAKKKAKVMA